MTKKTLKEQLTRLGKHATSFKFVLFWLVVLLNFYTYQVWKCSYSTNSWFCFQMHSHRCCISVASFIPQMQSIIVHILGGASLEDLYLTIEPKTADSAAEDTAECTTLYSTDVKRGYRRKRTEFVSRFVMDFAKVFLSMKDSREKEADASIGSILPLAALDTKRFWSYKECNG